MPHLTAAQFTERFAALILSGKELPKKPQDRHVLFVSSILKLTPGRRYTESELNDELRAWTSQFGANSGLDHASLRRYLVDEKYLVRDAAGGTYELAPEPPYTFDDAVRELNLAQLVADARQARELKKQQFMNRVQS